MTRRPPRVCERCSAEIGSGPFVVVETIAVGSPLPQGRRWLCCPGCGEAVRNFLACPPATLEALGLAPVELAEVAAASISSRTPSSSCRPPG